MMCKWHTLWPVCGLNRRNRVALICLIILLRIYLELTMSGDFVSYMQVFFDNFVEYTNRGWKDFG